MKILNLYSGIGGNRKLWLGHKITAVEFDPKIARVYQNSFPNDKVIVDDASKFLENHFREYDFIWSSPPCQTHSQYRHNVGVIGKGFNPVMPDMSLYAQIVFLKTYFNGKWCIENVKPYYPPLIEPSFVLQRHLFWANFSVPEKEFLKAMIRDKNKISDFEGFEAVESSDISNKRQVLRNCVDPEVGLHIISALDIPIP